MIFVTGATGFVGSAVCRGLELRGSSVLRAVRRQVRPDDAAVVVGDIDSKTEWAEKALNRVDAVVHLAARVHQMRDTAADPLAEFRKVNVEGARRLAEAAAVAGVKRFVFVSSIKVNGEMTDGGRPFTEMDLPHPVDAYGISKWEAEQTLLEIGRRTGMEVVILRLPLVYGPGVKANFLKLIKHIDRGLPLPFGCIRNQRSLLGLANLVNIICCCLDHQAAAGETFLASDGDDVSTPELVRRIARAFGRPARLVPMPVWMMQLGGRAAGRPEQVMRLCGSLQIDSSKIRQKLGWTPVCTMEEELRGVAEWYSGRNSIRT
jgi:nucleoside-diphosphate-sugar epimerase